MYKLNYCRYWVYILWLSYRKMWQQNLGDKVIYKGNIYTITNGVISNQWTLRLNPDGLPDEENALRSECVKVKSVSNYIGSFKSARNFYMGYWIGIWARQGIQQWVRNCNIWPD